MRIAYRSRAPRARARARAPSVLSPRSSAALSDGLATATARRNNGEA